jgi:hypothetical protein
MASPLPVVRQRVPRKAYQTVVLDVCQIRRDANGKVGRAYGLRPGGHGSDLAIPPVRCPLTPCQGRGQVRLRVYVCQAASTFRGCPAVTDGLDGELARLQDQGTGGMAPLLQRRAPRTATCGLETGPSFEPASNARDTPPVIRRSLGSDEDQGAEASNRRARPQTTCPLPARSAGQRRELTVTPGQPDAPAHLRTGRVIRCANRPSKQEVRTERDGLSSPGAAAPRTPCS